MPDTLIKGYKELENKFKDQVKKDRKLLHCNDIVYLPAFLKPTRKVKYVFISMEPSLTKKWAPDRNTAEAQIEGGFRNFAPGRFEDTILHYCVHKYLPANFNEYYITDMSKGAMPPQIANKKRITTWLNWSQLLKEELTLVAEEDAQIFAIGKKVHGFLEGKTNKKKILQDNNDIVDWIKKRFRGKPIYLLHHSPQTCGYRGKYIKENDLENDYACYKLNKGELLKFADILLSNTHAETNLKEFCMKRLGNQEFNDSLKKLAFVYKDMLRKKRTG